jgi:lipid-binding SYLF domain-containing protein
MKRAIFLSLILITAPVFAAKNKTSSEDTKRMNEAANVMTEIMNAKDQSIPDELLENAHCIGIVPNLKRVGFVVGAKFGKGVLSCRTGNGWSAPSMIRIEGGNIGLQIGAGETDVVFVVMNAKGEDQLMKDKFTVGADVTGMAGPVGRSAEAKTDVLAKAEIVSYSRSHGLFAGVTLDGATLRPDTDANRSLYGRETSQPDILHGKVAAPAGARTLMATLSRYSPRKTG